jgi:hypothetical protein
MPKTAAQFDRLLDDAVGADPDLPLQLSDLLESATTAAGASNYAVSIKHQIADLVALWQIRFSFHDGSQANYYIDSEELVPMLTQDLAVVISAGRTEHEMLSACTAQEKLSIMSLFYSVVHRWKASKRQPARLTRPPASYDDIVSPAQHAAIAAFSAQFDASTMDKDA